MKKIFLALIIASLITTTPTAASDTKVPALFGQLALIALVAATQHPQKTHYFDGPTPRSAPHKYYPKKPWSRSWFDYCFSKHPTFNPRNGHFINAFGHYQFCE